MPPARAEPAVEVTEPVRIFPAAGGGQLRAAVLGPDSRRDRARMKERGGIQRQASAHFDPLTLIEILDLFGPFYPAPFPPDELLHRVLQEKRSAKIKELPGGRAQRFSIVALVNDPEVRLPRRADHGHRPARPELWELQSSSASSM